MSKTTTTDAVQVQLARWGVEFEHRLSALCARTGTPPATLAVREGRNVPRGSVLLYFDPSKFGRVVCCYHPLDFEQVHHLINHHTDCRLCDIETIQRAA